VQRRLLVQLLRAVAEREQILVSIGKPFKRLAAGRH
jgi:hypothetical protein